MHGNAALSLQGGASLEIEDLTTKSAGMIKFEVEKKPPILQPGEKKDQRYDCAPPELRSKLICRIER